MSTECTIRHARHCRPLRQCRIAFLMSAPNLGWPRVPVIEIGSTVPAPSPSSIGSNTFRTSDFHPVCVCDAFACRRNVPLKSSTSRLVS